MENSNLLSAEEVLLLNNLMYLSGDPMVNIRDYENKTVAEIIRDLKEIPIDPGREYSTFTNGEEWSQIINAVENNDTLMNMQIAAVHIDDAPGGGGGISAVWTSPETGEAVVAFRGTAAYEWKDNFIGGGSTDAPDGVSTPQQENALEWYQSAYEELGLDGYTVTITGHSKGGNKAKYVTLMDESADRCLSFDGQGFSDEFIEKYREQIAGRQDLIENHNVDYDYVNLLLNDIGKKYYYKGDSYGDGKFLEAHAPNTLLTFDENGNYYLNPSEGGQSREMHELDEFLNSCLRSLSTDEKKKALQLFGSLAEGGFSDEADMDFFLELLLSSDNQDTTAYILAYLLEYEQANPGFADSIESVLNEFGMGDIAKIVDTIQDVINSRFFDPAVDIILAGGKKLPDWILKPLLNLLYEKTGLRFSLEEIRRILAVADLANKKMDEITIKKNSGKDKSVPSSGKGNFSGTGEERWTVYTQNMRGCAQRLSSGSRGIQQIAAEITGLVNQLNGTNQKFRPVLSRIVTRIEEHKNIEKNMADKLVEIAKLYDSTEKRIVNYR